MRAIFPPRGLLRTAHAAGQGWLLQCRQCRHTQPKLAAYIGSGGACACGYRCVRLVTYRLVSIRTQVAVLSVCFLHSCACLCGHRNAWRGRQGRASPSAGVAASRRGGCARMGLVVGGGAGGRLHVAGFVCRPASRGRLLGGRGMPHLPTLPLEHVTHSLPRTPGPGCRRYAPRPLRQRGPACPGHS